MSEEKLINKVLLATSEEKLSTCNVGWIEMRGGPALDQSFRETLRTVDAARVLFTWQVQKDLRHTWRAKRAPKEKKKTSFLRSIRD